MLNFLRQNPNRLLVILLALFTLLNLVTAMGSELIGDECYYWFISKNLELGYLDHPPFFAWLAHAGVRLLGDTELAVRLLTVLIYPATLYIFWTVVRTENSDYRSAIRYFLVSFSIPVLHIYGFIASPDAPLLLAIAITIWAFKRYAYSVRWADNGYLYSILFLAFGFALMGYAKYQGVLVVLAVVISRPKMLVDWRVYMVAAIALVLYAPHLYWQYTHDFVSFKYHLVEHQQTFRFGMMSGYILNFIGAYNPFLTVPFIVMLVRRNPYAKEPVERLMRVMAVFTLIYFLYSTFKGTQVQSQWMLPVAFSIIFMLCRAAENRARFARYLIVSSVFMGLLILAIHILVLVVDKSINKIELFGKEKNFKEFAATLDGTELFIMEGNYAASSMMNFYTDHLTYARPSLYSGSSQYQFIEMDTPFYGKRVAIEIGDRGRNSIPEDTLAARYESVVMPVVGRVFYYIDEHYIPSGKVEITLQSFPPKVLINQNLALTLTIGNPYPFDIPLGGADGFVIVMHIKARNGDNLDIPLPFKEQPLGGGGTVRIPTSVTIPDMETGHYAVGFSLQRYISGSWYNSKIFDLLIVNPKTRV